MNLGILYFYESNKVPRWSRDLKISFTTDYTGIAFIVDKAEEDLAS